MDGNLTLTCMNQAMAQMMGGEYVCEDEWGEEYPSSLPCDEEACVAACSICGEQFDCEESHCCDWITCSICYTQYIRGQGHTCTVVGDNNENENGNTGGGSGGSGGSSGTGGGVGTNPDIGDSSIGSESFMGQPIYVGTQAITDAAKYSVDEVIKTDRAGKRTAKCNKGVLNAFKKLFNNSTELDNKRANDMVRHWNTSPNWKEIDLHEAQEYANKGYFTVAGWINPEKGTDGTERSGHVVVIVPGVETKSNSWNTMVPCTMDTGYNMRNPKQTLSLSFGSKKKIMFNILFILNKCGYEKYISFNNYIFI